jgi:hypothetical protein
MVSTGTTTLLQSITPRKRAASTTTLHISSNSYGEIAAAEKTRYSLSIFIAMFLLEIGEGEVATEEETTDKRDMTV